MICHLGGGGVRQTLLDGFSSRGNGKRTGEGGREGKRHNEVARTKYLFLLLIDVILSLVSLRVFGKSCDVFSLTLEWFFFVQGEED